MCWVLFSQAAFQQSNLPYSACVLSAGAPPGAARTGRPTGRSDPDVHQCHEQS